MPMSNRPKEFVRSRDIPFKCGILKVCFFGEVFRKRHGTWTVLWLKCIIQKSQNALGCADHDGELENTDHDKLQGRDENSIRERYSLCEAGVQE